MSGYGSGDKALQECNLSTESSVDCIDCIRPVWAKSRTGFLASWLLPGCLCNHGQSEKLIVHQTVEPE
jgi:hypothetical protein